MNEIRPILSALRFHKTSTILVSLQIAVSLAIIVNALFIIKQRIDKVNRPTGIDVENVIVVSVRGVGTYDRKDNIQRDLDALRNMPGVLDATVPNHIPLTTSGSSTGLRAQPDENLTAVNTARYRADDHFLNSLGVTIDRGRNFYPDEIPWIIPGEEGPGTSPVVIVTQELADKLYPDEDALGKPVYWASMKPSTIVGIIGHMQGPLWGGWSGINRVVIHPGIPANQSNRYIIRVKPGLRDQMMPEIEAKLIDLNRSRVIKYVRSHTDMMNESYQIDHVMANILIGVIVLLTSLVALVIGGLASYFVNQRTRQIGTRRALGAKRSDILKYFLLENWLITTTGAVMGAVLTVGVGYWLETSFSLPRLDWRYLASAVVVLWIVSQLAAYFPARKAAGVAPALATRTV